MSAKLVAEYGVADHLVIYSEDRMSVWRRDVDVRPARKRIRILEDGSLQQSIEANSARQVREVERIRHENEVAAQKARFKARCAELRKKFYG